MVLVLTFGFVNRTESCSGTIIRIVYMHAPTKRPSNITHNNHPAKNESEARSGGIEGNGPMCETIGEAGSSRGIILFPTAHWWWCRSVTYVMLNK